jgi:WD40 repeat protein
MIRMLYWCAMLILTSAVPTWGEALTFSSDGRTALLGRGRTIMVWEVASGDVLQTLNMRMRMTITEGDRVIWSADADSRDNRDLPYFLSFSASNALALSRCENGLFRLWDLKAGQMLQIFGERWTFPPDFMPRGEQVAFSPDGRLAAEGYKTGVIAVWDVATGQVSRHIDAHSNFVNVLVFAPDGLSLASASRDGDLKLWDVASGREIRVLKRKSAERIGPLAFSRDGRLLLSQIGENTILVWDTRSGLKTRSLILPQHHGGFTSISVSADGRVALAGSWNETISVWDLTSGNLVRVFGGRHSVPFTITETAFSPDGQFALSSDAKTLKLWDINKGRILRTFQLPEIVQEP